MEFILLLHSDEAGWNALTGAEQASWMAGYEAFVEAMESAGVLRGGNHLQSTAKAATVRVTNGRTQVRDGPVGHSKEQLAGFFVIEVPDRDAAIAWAERCPGARHGAVEVRALGVPPEPREE